MENKIFRMSTVPCAASMMSRSTSDIAGTEVARLQRAGRGLTRT
jgi:hypothetical protein